MSLDGTDKVTLAVVSMADSNAQWYYANISKFKYFLYPLNAIFALIADNAKNLTKILLTDVDNPNNQILLTKSFLSPY